MSADTSPSFDVQVSKLKPAKTPKAATGQARYITRLYSANLRYGTSLPGKGSLGWLNGSKDRVVMSYVEEYLRSSMEDTFADRYGAMSNGMHFKLYGCMLSFEQRFL
jgi:hypothetical protein